MIAADFNGLINGQRPATYEDALWAYRRTLLARALVATRGNRSAAARELGVTRQHVLYLIKRLGLGLPERKAS